MNKSWVCAEVQLRVLRMYSTLIYGCIDQRHSVVWYGMVWYGMVWYGMVEVCEGAPVAVSGWVARGRIQKEGIMCSIVWYGTELN